MCGLIIETEKDQVLSIKGDKSDPLSKGHICPKALGLQDIHFDPDRLKRPLKKVNGAWVEIDWDTAFDEVADKIKDIQARHGNKAVGVYQGNPSVHNLGTTLFSPGFVRSLNTTNRFSATSVDQLPHHLAGMMMLGHPSLIPIPDIDHTDFWLILGGNPMVSNGSLMTAPDIAARMRNIQKRGGKVVVVDPRFTETARKADQHIFVKPGSDVWLLLGMIRLTFKNEKVNLRHISSLIDPAQIEELKRISQSANLAKVSKETGIATEVIETLWNEFVKAASAVCYGRMGVSTVEFGGISHWMINSLNIITGNFDRPGGSMLSSPLFDPITRGRQPFARFHSRVRNLPEHGGELPSSVMAEEIMTEGQDQIKAMIISCGNPVLSTPNGQQLDKAFEQLDLMVSIDIYLNESSRHADYILPPATGLEVPHYGIGFHQLAVQNTAKYSAPTFAKDESQRYDYEIFLELQKRMEADRLPSDEESRNKILAYYQSTPEDILAFKMQKNQYNISFKEVLDSPSGIDLGPLKTVFPDRIKTDSGQINLTPDLYVKDVDRLLAKPAREADEFLLIGRRHLRSNNSWLHNSKRLVKGRNRCTALIHPKDAGARGLAQGEEIAVTSRVATLNLPVEISDEIMEGVISIPHGWGHHRKGTGIGVAEAHAGVSANDLTDELFIDELCGNAAVNGVPVTIKKLVVAVS